MFTANKAVLGGLAVPVMTLLDAIFSTYTPTFYQNIWAGNREIIATLFALAWGYLVYRVPNAPPTPPSDNSNSGANRP